MFPFRKLKFQLVSAGILALAAACVVAPPRGPASDRAAPLSAGQRIAEANCAVCHAIGRSGRSPHPDARPFRELSRDYPIRNLEEALAEGIVVGHPDMPAFAFAPDEIDALLSYIESIQTSHSR